MPTALVTGPSERIADIAGALRGGGYRPYCVAEGVSLAAACDPIPPASLACYLQLPGTLPDRAGEPAAGPSRLARGLVRRFDALDVVAPLLAPGARVVLVAGHQAGAERDTGETLPALVPLLARAVLADHGAIDVVVEVVSDGHSPAELAATARFGAGPGRSVLAGAGALASPATGVPDPHTGSTQPWRWRR